MPNDAPSRRLTFEPVITAGNLVSAFVMAAGIMVWGLRLEGTVAAERTLRDEQHQEFQRQLSEQRESVKSRMDMDERQHRDDLRDIKESLSRIELKLDTKADKP